MFQADLLREQKYQSISESETEINLDFKTKPLITAYILMIGD
jgi:hypothetical protein